MHQNSSIARRHIYNIIIAFTIIVTFGFTACQRDNNQNGRIYEELLLQADSVSAFSPQTSDSIYRFIFAQPSLEHSAYYARALLGASKGVIIERNFDSAAELISQAGRIAEELKDTILLLDYLNSYGGMYYDQDKTEKAMSYFKRGMLIAKSTKNDAKMIPFTINIGKIYLQNGDNVAAARALNEGLTAARKSGNLNSEAVALHSLASLSALIEEYSKAISYSRQAMAISLQKNDQREYASGLVNLGIYFKNSGEMDSALLSYKQAYKIFRSINDTFNLVLARYNMGVIYLKQKEYRKAELEMKDIYNYSKLKNIAQGQTYSLWALATVYEETNQIMKGLQSIDSAIELARKQNLISDLSKLYDRRHSLLARTGQYQEAYKTAVVSREISDSITGIDKQKEILELQAKYETERKDSENKLLKKDIEVQKSRLALHRMSLIIGSLFIVILLFYFYYRQKKYKHARHLESERSLLLILENKNAQIELEKAELENRLKNKEIGEMSLQNELKEGIIEKLELSEGLKEQELVYQALVRVELTQVLRSVQGKLSPFLVKFSRKKDQENFEQALSEITHYTIIDPLSEFEMLFKQLHPGFYEKLLSRCPSLSKSELQVSAMIRLNLASKDIARLVNLSLSTVETTRYHVRQKLELDPKENLTLFLLAV